MRAKNRLRVLFLPSTLKLHSDDCAMSNLGSTPTGANRAAAISSPTLVENRSPPQNTSGAVRQSGDDSNADLRARIHSLLEDPHVASECFRSSRPILIEAFVWVAAGLIIWIAGIIAFG